MKGLSVAILITGLTVSIFNPATTGYADETKSPDSPAVLTEQTVEDAQTKASASSHYVSPLEQAGIFVREAHNNIGILITFGTGNEVTPEQTGEWAISRLNERAATQGKQYYARYFVLYSEKGEGIAISYLVGLGQGVGPKDITEAKNSTVLDEVFEKRDLTAGMLANRTIEQR